MKKLLVTAAIMSMMSVAQALEVKTYELNLVNITLTDTFKLDQSIMRMQVNSASEKLQGCVEFTSADGKLGNIGHCSSLANFTSLTNLSDWKYLSTNVNLSTWTYEQKVTSPFIAGTFTYYFYDSSGYTMAQVSKTIKVTDGNVVSDPLPVNSCLDLQQSLDATIANLKSKNSELKTYNNYPRLYHSYLNSKLKYEYGSYYYDLYNSYADRYKNLKDKYQLKTDGLIKETIDLEAKIKLIEIKMQNEGC